MADAPVEDAERQLWSFFPENFWRRSAAASTVDCLSSNAGSSPVAFALKNTLLWCRLQLLRLSNAPVIEFSQELLRLKHKA